MSRYVDETEVLAVRASAMTLLRAYVGRHIIGAFLEPDHGTEHQSMMDMRRLAWPSRSFIPIPSVP